MCQNINSTIIKFWLFIWKRWKLEFFFQKCFITLRFSCNAYRKKNFRDLTSSQTFLISNIRFAQKIKFSIKGFFSKCDQIRSFLRIWSHLLKKSLTENFIFCAVTWFQTSCIQNVQIGRHGDLRKIRHV